MDKPSAPAFAPVLSDDPAADPLDARLARALVAAAAACVAVVATLTCFI